MEKSLGKISHASFGIGGYQDSQIGLHLQFSGVGWGVCMSHSAWDFTLIPHTQHCKWTEQERREDVADAVELLSKTLAAAKVKSVQQLIGKPVEVTLDGGMLKEWRIIEEVI